MKFREFHPKLMLFTTLNRAVCIFFGVLKYDHANVNTGFRILACLYHKCMCWLDPVLWVIDPVQELLFGVKSLFLSVKRAYQPHQLQLIYCERTKTDVYRRNSLE